SKPLNARPLIKQLDTLKKDRRHSRMPPRKDLERADSPSNSLPPTIKVYSLPSSPKLMNTKENKHMYDHSRTSSVPSASIHPRENETQLPKINTMTQESKSTSQISTIERPQHGNS